MLLNTGRICAERKERTTKANILSFVSAALIIGGAMSQVSAPKTPRGGGKKAQRQRQALQLIRRSRKESLNNRDGGIEP